MPWSGKFHRDAWPPMVKSLCSWAVGHALSVCQDDSVPCHRVVNRLGGLSDAFSPFGRESHRLLLALEEVPFTPEGRADLSRCLWQGPQIPSNLT